MFPKIKGSMGNWPLLATLSYTQIYQRRGDWSCPQIYVGPMWKQIGLHLVSFRSFFQIFQKHANICLCSRYSLHPKLSKFRRETSLVRVCLKDVQAQNGRIVTQGLCEDRCSHQTLFSPVRCLPCPQYQKQTDRGLLGLKNIL